MSSIPSLVLHETASPSDAGRLFADHAFSTRTVCSKGPPACTNRPHPTGSTFCWLPDPVIVPGVIAEISSRLRRCLRAGERSNSRRPKYSTTRSYSLSVPLTTPRTRPGLGMLCRMSAASNSVRDTTWPADVDGVDSSSSWMTWAQSNITRQKLRASPWQMCGMRLSGNGKWQRSPENPRGR